MSDVVDIAGAQEAEMIDDGIARARRALPHGKSAETCYVCGEAIPESRRVALPGVKTCIGCQEILEHAT